MLIDNLLSKKQQEFFFAKDRRLNFLIGSVRSGKTYVSLLKFAIMVVATSPKNSAFLFAAKTLTTLKRNCLAPLKNLVGEANFVYNISKKEGSLFGRTVYLEGANDETSENKIRGMTLAGAYCDEVTLFPESFFTMLLSRLSEPNAKLYATCNPDTPNHYIKTEYIDNDTLDVKTWEFLLNDNVFLSKEYLENIVKEYTGVHYSRYILGQWVRAEGVIYALFADNPSAFLLPVDQSYNDIVKINIGVDFGGSRSATSFVCTGFTRGLRNVIILESERHPEELTPDGLNDIFVEFAEKCLNKYGKPIDVYADSAEQVLIRGIRTAVARKGLKVMVHNARKMPIIERILLVNKLIGLGRFWVNRHCVDVTKALQDAVWDEDKDNERLDDFSSDIDTLDAMEYSIEPYFNELSRS